VLDESGGFSSPLDVRVSDGQIIEVGPDLESRGDISIDFSGLWLMPGVFDCHAHVAVSSIDPLEILRTPVTEWALEAVVNMRRTLEAGVTYVRDASGADAGIRSAVAKGFVPGPSLQVAVVQLCQTGGYYDGFLRGFGLESSADYVAPFPGRPPYQVDGVDEVRKGVRAILRAGADWIKICATGGILAPEGDGVSPEFSHDEIAVAVHEASKRGKSVMAHAMGGDGLMTAVLGGVRSIEHGVLLTEEQAGEMAKRECFLVPTRLAIREVVLWAEEGGILPPYAERKARLLGQESDRSLAIARHHGVKVALGSDIVRRDQHGNNLSEIALLHEAGLSVEEALLAATFNGAQLCGVSERYGRIAPGYVFDAIVLDEDPSDLRIFYNKEAVTGVFKDGIPVVPHARVADVEAGAIGLASGTERP
jgi:imidazolonepropionase-like amidohydrolase